MRAGRKRLRELGIQIGRFPTGQLNAITDVKGVRVGHVTLIDGSGPLVPGRGPVRTGVTAIVPRQDMFHERLVGGAFVLNGAGEVSGLTQLDAWGLLETPILLTNTMSLGLVSSASSGWMVSRYPEIGVTADVVIPVVGECDDSWLNDAGGQHVEEHHVIQALEGAHDGPVEEGAVGGGTGMVCCDFKGGIGTSSRIVEIGSRHFTLGVLAMTNFGVMRDLRIDGLRIGELLEPDLGPGAPRRRFNQGSIICVLATDVPLVSEQMRRLCKRVALGVGRTGSYAAPASGEIMVAFSTANSVPRQSPGHEVYRLDALLDSSVGPLYEATLDVTEEAILNSLTAASDMEGLDGHFAPAIPLDRVAEIFERHTRILRG